MLLKVLQLAVLLEVSKWNIGLYTYFYIHIGRYCILFFAASALCPDLNYFLDKASIANAADAINASDDVVLYDGMQTIFPQLAFACDDSVVSSWMVGARVSGNNGSLNAQLQIWRPVSPRIYVLHDFIELINPSITLSRNLYQFEPKTAMSVKSRDVMGLYNPPFANGNWLVYQALKGNGSGVLKFLTSTDLPFSMGSMVTLMPGSESKESDYPLVKPVIGMCMHSWFTYTMTTPNICHVGCKLCMQHAHCNSH